MGEKLECTNARVGRLITRYEVGALEESEREMFVNHLIECAYCHNEVYSMAPYMGVFKNFRLAAQTAQLSGEQIDGQRKRPEGTSLPLWRRKPFLAAASVLMTIGIAVVAVSLYQRHSGAGLPEPARLSASRPETEAGAPAAWSEVEIPKASYTRPGGQPLFRGGASVSEFDNAMVAYQQDDFAAAADRLEVVSRLEPEYGQAFFYWGVSLLLQGKSRDAIAPLRKAVDLSAGERRGRSHYYLALAYLKTNRPGRALDELDAIAGLTGEEQTRAEQVRQEILETMK